VHILCLWHTYCSAAHKQQQQRGCSLPLLSMHCLLVAACPACCCRSSTAPSPLRSVWQRGLLLWHRLQQDSGSRLGEGTLQAAFGRKSLFNEVSYLGTEEQAWLCAIMQHNRKASTHGKD